MRVRAYYNPCPGPIGLASILASTQILAWPENLAWPKIWPLIFFLPLFFQNSDLFCDVLIMISMIDWLFKKLYLNDFEFFVTDFFFNLLLINW